jgi:hypothetical protein
VKLTVDVVERTDEVDCWGDAEYVGDTDEEPVSERVPEFTALDVEEIDAQRDTVGDEHEDADIDGDLENEGLPDIVAVTDVDGESDADLDIVTETVADRVVMRLGELLEYIDTDEDGVDDTQSEGEFETVTDADALTDADKKEDIEGEPDDVMHTVVVALTFTDTETV